MRNFLFLFVFLVFACTEQAPAPPTAPAPEPAPTKAPPRGAPVIEGMPGMDGPHLRKLAGQFEKGALVNVWASWCGSCKRELPMMREVQKAYAEHGLGLVLVSVDDTVEGLKAARQLLDETGIKDHAYYLASRVSSFKAAIDPRWQGAIPSTFLLDSAGDVRYFWNGPVMADEISPIAQGFLSGENIDGMADLAAKPN